MITRVVCNALLPYVTFSHPIHMFLYRFSIVQYTRITFNYKLGRRLNFFAFYLPFHDVWTSFGA